MFSSFVDESEFCVASEGRSANLAFVARSKFCAASFDRKTITLNNFGILRTLNNNNNLGGKLLLCRNNI